MLDSPNREGEMKASAIDSPFPFPVHPFAVNFPNREGEMKASTLDLPFPCPLGTCKIQLLALSFTTWTFTESGNRIPHPA